MRRGGIVSYSRKVFLPLTHLCRDVCHYCTFAQPASTVARPYMPVETVLAQAKAAEILGCKEALLTLGERPELRWRAARDALDAMGFASTVDYVAHIAEVLLVETGLLPHVNAGTLTAADLARLRPLSPSMGMMLETASPRLSEKGGPHFGSPDKHPEVRLETLRLAGEARVPFTTGILIGIGETRGERIESLEALRAIQDRYGHLQEIILQSFRAKPATRMAEAEQPDLAELLWTIQVARSIFDDGTPIQVPPNLSPQHHRYLLDAGIDDWGGISPVTPDFVNPEAPWPHIDALAEVTAAAGKSLVERLTVYPKYALNGEAWLDPAMRRRVLERIDADGLARTEVWRTGQSVAVPGLIAGPSPEPAADFAELVEKAASGTPLVEGEVVRLFSARGQEAVLVRQSADALRRRIVGDAVTYVVNRNINYTNICTFGCSFCAFSRGRLSDGLRGRPYNLSLDDIAQRTIEAWERGATEVCLQGGIHPSFGGRTYFDILEAVKSAVPSIHVHAFSPLEILHGAQSLGRPVRDYLRDLRGAGLGSLPGTAAEILDDEVRRVLCPQKLSTGQWLEVVETAHEIGLPTTSTIMFGHIDRPVHWARHLLRLLEVQGRTGGFTEFVPLPFVAAAAPLYLKGQARPGPTFHEALHMHSVARLVLNRAIPNVQASWVKMGPAGVLACLEAGANDLGGTLMNESITRAAGATHGEELPVTTMREMIASIGRRPMKRTTLYDRADQDRHHAARDEFARCAGVGAPN